MWFVDELLLILLTITFLCSKYQNLKIQFEMDDPVGATGINCEVTVRPSLVVEVVIGVVV